MQFVLTPITNLYSMKFSRGNVLVLSHNVSASCVPCASPYSTHVLREWQSRHMLSRETHNVPHAPQSTYEPCNGKVSGAPSLVILPVLQCQFLKMFQKNSEKMRMFTRIPN